MILALALLLAAFSHRVPLIEETIVVPPKDWRAIDLGLEQRPAVVDCRFTVLRGRSGVRIALMPRDELDRLEAGQSHRVLAATGLARSGVLRYRPSELGDYALVVDNRMQERGPAEVRLEVSLDFGPAGAVPVRTLSPERRLLIVLLTLGLFAAVLTYAGRKLRRAVRPRL